MKPHRKGKRSPKSPLFQTEGQEGAFLNPAEKMCTKRYFMTKITG